MIIFLKAIYLYLIKNKIWSSFVFLLFCLGGILLFLFISELTLYYHEVECKALSLIITDNRPIPIQPFSSVRVNNTHPFYWGTHNSYHIQTKGDVVASHMYTHPFLKTQLDMGIRSLELDVHPNLLVYHVAFIDQQSNCVCFASCLVEIMDWIREQKPPYQLALITVMIEMKRDPFDTYLGKNTSYALQIERMENLIQSIIPDSLLVKAQEVDCSDTIQWPMHRYYPFKIAFLLDNENIKETSYSSLFFTLEHGDCVSCCFAKRDDPYRDFSSLVQRGVLVRTRADNVVLNKTRAEQAKKSGAQLISTDFEWIYVI